VLLRKSLLERARDKEAAVRVQAALGLAKLQSGEDEEDLEEGQEPLSEVLLDLLRYDPAAYVPHRIFTPGLADKSEILPS
jgi:condensin complex subunit 3